MSAKVLTRLVGERVVIGKGVIDIQVIGIVRGKVRLRITAPDDIPVERPGRDQDRMDREDMRLRRIYKEKGLV